MNEKMPKARPSRGRSLAIQGRGDEREQREDCADSRAGRRAVLRGG